MANITPNISIKDIGKSEVLKKRLLFTLFALIFFRLGSFIVVPGIDANALRAFFENFGRKTPSLI